MPDSQLEEQAIKLGKLWRAHLAAVSTSGTLSALVAPTASSATPAGRLASYDLEVHDAGMATAEDGEYEEYGAPDAGVDAAGIWEEDDARMQSDSPSFDNSPRVQPGSAGAGGAAGAVPTAKASDLGRWKEQGPFAAQPRGSAALPTHSQPPQLLQGTLSSRFVQQQQPIERQIEQRVQYFRDGPSVPFLPGISDSARPAKKQKVQFWDQVSTPAACQPPPAAAAPTRSVRDAKVAKAAAAGASAAKSPRAASDINPADLMARLRPLHSRLQPSASPQRPGRAQQQQAQPLAGSAAARQGPLAQLLAQAGSGAPAADSWRSYDDDYKVAGGSSGQRNRGAAAAGRGKQRRGGRHGKRQVPLSDLLNPNSPQYSEDFARNYRAQRAIEEGQTAGKGGGPALQRRLAPLPPTGRQLVAYEDTLAAPQPSAPIPAPSLPQRGSQLPHGGTALSPEGRQLQQRPPAAAQPADAAAAQRKLRPTPPPRIDSEGRAAAVVHQPESPPGALDHRVPASQTALPNATDSDLPLKLPGTPRGKRTHVLVSCDEHVPGDADLPEAARLSGMLSAQAEEI